MPQYLRNADSIVPRGTTGNKFAGTNKHGDGKPSSSLKRQPVGWHPQDKASKGKVHTVEEINSDFDELCFETSIQVDSSNFKPVRDEAIAKIQVDLPHIDPPNPMLKVKVESDAQGNVLPLRIFKNMVPGQVAWMRMAFQRVQNPARQNLLHSMAHKY